MKRVGVFFGGKSPEHDVSIITAQTAIASLKKNGYAVVPVYFSKEGEWAIGDELGTIKFFIDDDFEKKIKKNQWYYIDLEKSKNKIVFKSKSIFKKEIVVDIALPAFHGMNGEDGTIQGLFEIFNIPFVGCGVTSSAITIDKILTKMHYKSSNIKTAKFIGFSGSDWQIKKDEVLSAIKSQLKLPLFVKPARLGSSIGITKVKELKDLEFAIEVALHYDSKVLVEEGINNLKDLTCCVIGNKDLIISEVQESAFSDEFFSYDEKYLNDGGAQLGNAQKNIIIPAKLDNEVTKKIKELSAEIFKLFECSGIARIDFLYDSINNEVFANEINPLPGTFYHHLWKESGIGFDDLLKKLISYAEERYEEKKRINYVFESNLLEMTKSIKLKIQ